MKVIHGSLKNLVQEVKRHKLDAVRVAAFMQSDPLVSDTIPRYTAWVVVTVSLDFDLWAEWRLLVGRGYAEIADKGASLPVRIAQLMTDRLQEVRARVTAAGLEVRDGMLAHDAEALDGALE